MSNWVFFWKNIMAALPYIQLYTSDYLSDAAHLNTLEHGAYLLLIFNHWQRGESFKAKNEHSLNKRLATVARLSEQEWECVRETLSEFFEITETEWSHNRIERDLEKAFNQVNNPKRPSAEVWKKIKKRVFERDDFTCKYCGKRGVFLECDHVIPVSKGGSHDMFNLVSACFRSNRSKGARLISEWRSVNE
jgi:uncharacterized protein YdaU (DUF1376 family)